MLIVPAVCTGASFTAVTVIVRLCANVSAPPLAVPPLSATVQLKLAGPPLALPAARNFMPRKSVSEYTLPAVTAVVPSASTTLPNAAAGAPVTV